MTDRTWQDYETWVMTEGVSDNSAFHSHDGCDRINRSEKATERSETFVAHHEPDPCPCCHDDLERPSASSDEWRRALRYEVGQ